MRAISLKPSHLHYGWIIVAACFLATFGYGPFYAFGVFLKSLQTELEWSRAITSSIQSIHLIIYAFSGFLMVKLADRYGLRPVATLGAVLTGFGVAMCGSVQRVEEFYLFYGIASLGGGITWTIPVATVQKWFTKRRGLALGLSSAGAGAGLMFYAPMADLLIANYGWRMAYYIMGGGTGVLLLVVASLLAGSPQEKGLKPYGLTDFSPPATAETAALKRLQSWDLVKSGTFVMVVFIAFLTGMPQHVLSVHLVPAATDAGIERAVAASAFGLIGVFSIIGRVGMAVMADRVGFKRTLVICCFGSAVTYFWLTMVRESWMLYAFVIFYGFFAGARSSLVGGLIGSLFGMMFLGEIVGTVYGFSIAASALSPFLGGWIFDHTGSYRIVFLICTGFLALAAILAMAVRQPGASPGPAWPGGS